MAEVIKIKFIKTEGLTFALLAGPMGQAASMCRFRGCRYKKNKTNKNQQQQQQNEMYQPQQLLEQQQQQFNTSSSSLITATGTSPIVQIPAAGTATLTPPDSPAGEKRKKFKWKFPFFHKIF